MNMGCKACEACEGVRNHQNRTLRTAPYRARRRGVRAISLWDRTSHARRTARTINMEIESGWSPCRSGSSVATLGVGSGAEPRFSRVFGNSLSVVWHSARVGTGRHEFAPQISRGWNVSALVGTGGHESACVRPLRANRNLKFNGRRVRPPMPRGADAPKDSAEAPEVASRAGSPRASGQGRWNPKGGCARQASRAEESDGRARRAIACSLTRR